MTLGAHEVYRPHAELRLGDRTVVGQPVAIEMSAEAIQLARHDAKGPMGRDRRITLARMHRSALFGALEQSFADAHEDMRLSPHLAVGLVVARVIVGNAAENLTHEAF